MGQLYDMIRLIVFVELRYVNAVSVEMGQKYTTILVDFSGVRDYTIKLSKSFIDLHTTILMYSSQLFRLHFAV